MPVPKTIPILLYQQGFVTSCWPKYMIIYRMWIYPERPTIYTHITYQHHHHHVLAPTNTTRNNTSKVYGEQVHSQHFVVLAHSQVHRVEIIA